MVDGPLAATSAIGAELRVVHRFEVLPPGAVRREKLDAAEGALRGVFGAAEDGLPFVERRSVGGGGRGSAEVKIR